MGRQMADDLSGMAPDNAATALLLVDVVNALEFDGAQRLLEPAMQMARQVSALKAACRRFGIPSVYANDNFGRWQSNFGGLVDRYLEEGCRGAPVIRKLLPEACDYNVLKPKHSAFYASPLDLLLHHLDVRNVIIVGITADMCVSFTAHDAYIRDYRVLVPRDCTVALQAAHRDAALRQLERVVKADTRPWAELDLAELVKSESHPPRPGA